MWRPWLDAALVLLWAPTCAACGAPLDAPSCGCVCARCWREVAEARDLPAPAEGLRTAAIGPHDGALRQVVHALKYDGRRSLVRPLGALLRQRARAVLAGADLAVPVPLHPARLRARGFNQAAALAAHLGLPVIPALRRCRRTRAQADLPAQERHANVRGAFAATRRARAVDGRVVVLVDDVYTTGATVEACAAVLREVGAREVRVVTATRVAPPRA